MAGGGVILRRIIKKLFKQLLKFLNFAARKKLFKFFLRKFGHGKGSFFKGCGIGAGGMFLLHVLPHDDYSGAGWLYRQPGRQQPAHGDHSRNNQPVSIGFRIISGPVADRIAKKNLSLWGAVMMCAGCMACALTQGTGLLLAARIVHGIGFACCSALQDTISTWQEPPSSWPEDSASSVPNHRQRQWR